MKKKVLFAIITLLLFTGIAQAGVTEDIISFVSNHPAKLGVFYELDDDLQGAVGATAVPDVFCVKNLDLDLFVTGDEIDIFNDDDKAVLCGLSYNVKLTNNAGISVGVAAGAKRIETLQEFGEFQKGVTLCAKITF